jgi:hypothetical protein
MSVASEHPGSERAIPKALQVFGDRVHGRFAGIQHEWGIIQVEPSSGLACWHVEWREWRAWWRRWIPGEAAPEGLRSEWVLRIGHA